jgi:hypothetical protein
LEKRRNGVLEKWSVGEMECWRNGALEKWSVGEMERWRNGALEKWSVGEMERWVFFFPILQYSIPPLLHFF